MQSVITNELIRYLEPIGQVHSPGYRVTLILKNIANIKILGYEPGGKRKIPFKFHPSLRGGTGRE